MEVTSTNFKEILPKIQEVVKNASFLSIDCEFSGLNVVSEINAFDTPKQYYEKVRKNCRDFLVLQYGISAFRFVPGDNVFKQQSYNFYIFRRPINRNILDQRFLCQTSCIHFLITQGFDFNKLFKSGISYLNIAEETKYREHLDDRRKVRSTQNSIQQNPSEIISVPEEMQSFIDETRKEIDNFLSSDSTELQLPKCNAFMRRLVYQMAAQNYKNKIVLQTKQLQNKDRVLVATKFKSKEELEEIEKKLVEEEQNLLDDFIGFTKVLRIIVDSGKLIVGHNLCLDFLHTIDKFLTPLPENYDEFKECSRSLFSNIVDTKYMASSDAFKDLVSSTILKDLFGTVSDIPFKIPSVEIEDGGQGYTMEDEKDHEAGFDAYMTGLCFLSMWNYLGEINDVAAEDRFTDLKLLKPYLNKIYLMILRDNQYIDLRGEDPNPSRDHVFYLTFPKEWRLNNIIELFSPFGNVYVSWISESSAYVGLFKKEQAAVALSTLSQSDTYSIMTFTNRQAQLSGIQTPWPSPAPRRKRPSSETSSGGGSKKIKSDRESSFSSVFEPIMEDVEPEAELKTPPTPKKVRKEPAKQTFKPSDEWD